MGQNVSHQSTKIREFRKTFKWQIKNFKALSKHSGGLVSNTGFSLTSPVFKMRFKDQHSRMQKDR